MPFLQPEHRKNKNKSIIFSPKSEFLLSYEPHRILKPKIDNNKAYGEDFNINNALGGQNIISVELDFINPGNFVFWVNF